MLEMMFYGDKAINMGNNKEFLVMCSDFCVVENEIWLLHGEINALLKLDINSGYTSYICSFIDENMIQEYLFKRIIKVGCRLVIVPGTANNIYVYDYNKNVIIYKKYIRDLYKNSVAFNDACLIGEKVYCLPSEVGKPIGVIDVSNECSFQLLELSGCNMTNGYFNKCCSISSYVYAVNPRSKYLMCINSENGKTEQILIGELSGICGICGNDKYLYLQTTEEKELILYNLNEHKIEKTIKLKNATGAIGCFTDGKVWVDTNGLFSYVINFENESIGEIDKLKYGKQLLYTKYKSGPNVCRYKDFYYFNKLRSSIIRFDGDKEFEIEVRMSNEDIKKINAHIVREKDNLIINESGCFGLFDFLDML